MKKNLVSKRIIAALLAAGMTASLGVCSVSATEYPLTITTYGSDGKEMETTYEKAPEKVLAVYQGSIETMLALGLEDHLAAAAGLDNDVPEEQKAAFETVEYLDEFTPSLETVTMLQPDVIFVVYMPYKGDDPEALRQEKLDVILKDEAFASLNAVKNGRVVPIMLSEMYASATRTQDGIITFAKGLYPELVLE